MSDTNIHYLMRFRRKIDTVDKEWEADALSDDEISVGKEVEIPLDDDEDEEMEQKEEEWNDLGVDIFLQDDAQSDNDFGHNVLQEAVPSASLPRN